MDAFNEPFENVEITIPLSGAVFKITIEVWLYNKIAKYVSDQNNEVKVNMATLSAAIVTLDKWLNIVKCFKLTKLLIGRNP
jgi:hypothetical protein